MATVTTKHLNTLPHLKRPCEQCPWRLENQGKRHFGSFYSKKNLTRLWNQVRRGEGIQSCHMTDPSHPDHIRAGTKATAEPRECPGSVIVVRREIEQMANAAHEVTHAGVTAYLKNRKRGLTKQGVLFWVISRLQMGGVPFIGGPKLPDVDNDPAVGLPESLR